MEEFSLEFVDKPQPEERLVLRMALLQVIQDLVIARVPDHERVPTFQRAFKLLEQAGWGLDELVLAAEPGAAQDRLFATLGV